MKKIVLLLLTIVMLLALTSYATVASDSKYPVTIISDSNEQKLPSQIKMIGWSTRAILLRWLPLKPAHDSSRKGPTPPSLRKRVSNNQSLCVINMQDIPDEWKAYLVKLG